MFFFLQVIEALRPHGLTLPNLASIAEQQIGGFIQVGAHGTGARIPPVDEFCTSLKLVTTHMGTLTLSAHSKAEERTTGISQHTSTNPLFDVAKVGLGSLGIVTEVTLKCIPAHKLVEHTFVLTRKKAYEQINTLLKSHKHVRYMWIPFEDAVVVVTNDPEDDVIINHPSTGAKASAALAEDLTREQMVARRTHQFEPLTDLLLEICGGEFTEEQVLDMGFGELRDQLLAIAPLNLDHVMRCNKAEAEFWRRSEGYQVKPSDQLLQFDCGGQVGDTFCLSVLIGTACFSHFFSKSHSNPHSNLALCLIFSRHFPYAAMGVGGVFPHRILRQEQWQ